MTSTKKRKPTGRTMADDVFEAAVRALVWAVWNFIKGAPPYPWPMPHRRSLPRAAAHLGGAAFVVWLTWLRYTDPAAAAALEPRLIAGAHVLGAVALAALGWWWATRWLEHDHRVNKVKPAWDVVCEHFMYGTNWDARAYMHLTPALAADPLGVRVHAPKWFRDPKLRTAFVRDFKETVGIPGAVAHWGFEGRYSFVQFSEPARMPETVAFADPAVRAIVEASPEHKPLLGLGRRKAVRSDFRAESPHMLVSMSTGGGKSELFKSLIAHFMHHGAWVVVLDMKRQSQTWLRGLPGVDYWRDLAQMHRSLVAIAREGDRRNRAGDHIDGDPSFRRIIVAIEELNATINKLQQFWDVYRTDYDVFPDLTDAERRQRKSPAVLALNDILYMGRAVKINVMACGQLATAHALGGPAVRECFTARVIGRATKKAWAMLADLIENPPKVFVKKPGRFHLVVGPNCDEVQGVLFTDDEAKEYALSGAARPTYDEVFTPMGVPALADDDPRRTPLAGALADDLHPQARPDLRVVRDSGGVDELDPATAARAITMAAASIDEGQGIIPMKAAAIRRAKSRDPEFPKPAVDGTLWLPEQLVAWYANRPRKPKAAPPVVIEPTALEPGDDKALDAFFGPLPPADENGNDIPDELEDDDEDEVLV